ncbi:hypothetical protein A3758_13720 [Oleiphilus sp. HI0118]|uniref:SDR family NAD(P)-dependent oxidoreductase n=1 Tax=Oleiphilus sp. HI0079 TaxID=1822254 RepID=UPI0007C215D1|nr:SDR family oxidoreductase [Oleiphilus sp. HI0079]KZZ13771.1 hypothetical protein A3750_02885 [Oleiphilus sp. HI0079]KZZ43509.1 hypothetical protein A3758_19675 [Oleiphilus sp. HI0118]KZZ49903.1 hypothetical protein A3758_13720 [Oleiphilus sp. HI0118]
MGSTWQGKIVLVTGVGSGIGKALAELLASQGASLVLTDVNEANLKQTAKSLGNSVLIAEKADASSSEDWRRLAQLLKDGPGYLDALVNNAGMASFGYFDETSEKLFNKVMDVNFTGITIGCREMLPLLERSERGLIVNLASIFGLITIPMMTPYHASKFAVRGFTEALRQDFKAKGVNVDVLCVMPGGIRTNIAAGAESDSGVQDAFAKHFETVALTTPEKAAKVIEKGMRKRSPRILIGPDATLVDWFGRLWPKSYSKIINPLFRTGKMTNP